MIDLSEFTAKGDVRLYLNDVFKFGEYLAAADGKIAIIDFSSKGKFFGFSDEWHKERHYAKVLSQCFTLPDVELKRVTEITEEDYKDCSWCDGTGKSKSIIECPECHGYGYIEFYSDCNCYEVECKSCDGKGEVESDFISDCECCGGKGKTLLNVPFLKDEHDGKRVAMAGNYLQKIATLPNAKIGLLNGMYYFTFDGGMGACMPMSIQEEIKYYTSIPNKF